MAAEESGFDSVWVMDHFYQITGVGPRTDPMLEAYTLLGAIAARTERAGLGTMVTGVTYRNPAYLAKVVTTLDVISSGRAILGIGAAWNDDEHAGYGFGFPPVAERMERLEEALQICRAMFTKEAPSFTGRHYAITAALNRPRPIRPGGIPILIGGGGEQKTLRLVAKYGDACNIFGDVTTVRHKLEVLNRHCEALGTATQPRVGQRASAPSSSARTPPRRNKRKLASHGRKGGTACGTRRRYTAIRSSGTRTLYCEQAAAFLDAGPDSLIFEHPRHAGPRPVPRLGKALSTALR